MSKVLISLFIFIFWQSSRSLSQKPDFNIILHFDDVEEAGDAKESNEAEKNSTKVENEIDFTNKQYAGGSGNTNTISQDTEPSPEPSNSIGSCQFSRDCEAYRKCENIQDASCVCNFGKCVISGNPFYSGSQCSLYTECACRNTPDSCFCRGGFCVTSKWECHEAADCKKLSKCADNDCACTGDLCEFDCQVDGDCQDFHCNKALGYMCKCEKSLCAYKKKPTECSNISDCITKGLCTEDIPCACTQSYCTLPWWVNSMDMANKCRTDQDCEASILQCQGGKCYCSNMQSVNDYERIGSCGTKH